MRMIWRGLAGLSALCVVIFVAMSCVGGGGEYNQSAGKVPALPEFASETLAPPSPSPLFPNPYSPIPSPPGVSETLWRQLNTELEMQLSAVKVTSTPPLRPLSQSVLSENGTDLLWGYYSNGDYDQNGEVNTADLAPIAIHFKESAYPFKFPPNSVQAVIDGDDNGEINIADVTPIAVNFQNTVAKYNVYRSQNIADYPTEPDGNNGDAELIASVNLADAFGAPNETRLQFDSALPETLTQEYIWVRPEDNSEVEGIASNRIGPLNTIYTLDGHVFMAGGGSDPLPGVPVALSGDATAQTVTDINGHYSFTGLLSGDYSVTPSGDPYGYAPEFIATTIDSADKYLSPIYPAPVDIIRRWGIEETIFVSTNDQTLDDENNVYLAVNTVSEGQDVAVVLKYDMFGNLLWRNTKQFGLGISIRKILLDESDNIYLAGSYTTAPDEGLNSKYVDVFLLKLDGSGAEEWFFSYSSSTPPATDVNQAHHDHGKSLAFDPEGNLLCWGVAQGMPGYPSFYLKVSPDGELLEENYIDAGGVDTLTLDMHYVRSDPSGNSYSSGSLDLGLGMGNPGFMMKRNSSGEVLWSNYWGNEYSGCQTTEIQFGLDGSLFAVTNIQRDDYQLGDTHLARITPEGDVSWEVQLTTDFRLAGPDFAIGPKQKLWVLSSEYIRTGMFPHHNYPYVMSFNQDGDLRFARRWYVDTDGNKTDVQDIKVNSYGVCLIAGNADEQDGVWDTPEITLTRPEHEQFSQEIIPYDATGIVDTAVVTTLDVTGEEYNQGYGYTTLLMYYRP